MNHITKTNRTITVGIADKQPAILDYAAEEAERMGYGITLVHAYSVPPSALGTAYGVDIPVAFRSSGQEVLAEALDHLTRDGVTSAVHCVLRRGSAASVLEAESLVSSSLVIGPDESKPWFVRLFEGRVARHLAAHARCPVVVVPDSWQSIRSEAPIVVMIDGVASAPGPLQFAFATASSRGADLRVLHVASEEDRGGTDWEAIRQVVHSWFDQHPHVHGNIEVVSGDVREAAVRAGDGAAMLIIGRPRERRLGNVLMDSLAQQIIARAQCPVAVVPGTVAELLSPPRQATGS